jgi:hypothetical protein
MFRSRLAMPHLFDNGTFARFVPFGDGREVIVRRGREMGTCSYGLEQSHRSVKVAGNEIRIVRYTDLLSPPPLTPGAPLVVDDGNYGKRHDVVYLPDAEILLDRGPRGFDDAEVEKVLAAIHVDER